MTKSKISNYNLNKGRIFIIGDINESSVLNFVHKIRYIFFEKKIKQIYVYICSDGGDFDSGCAIMDEIIGFQKIGANISTIAIGKACSAAAIILSIGTERYATQNSIIMLHQISCDREDNINNLKDDMAFTHRQYKEVMEVVARRCGYNTKTKIDTFIEKVDKVMQLLPKDAKKVGIIDDIWNYEWETLDDNKSESNI